MGKMMNALMLVFGIELAIFIFVKPGYEATSMFGFFIDLISWNTDSFLKFSIDKIALLGIAGIVVGAFITKHDWIWRAGMASATFFTFGSVIAQFWGFLNAHLGSIITSADASQYIAAIITAPLMFYFIFAAIDFISGKD